MIKKIFGKKSEYDLELVLRFLFRILIPIALAIALWFVITRIGNGFLPK